MHTNGVYCLGCPEAEEVGGGNLYLILLTGVKCDAYHSM